VVVGEQKPQIQLATIQELKPVVNTITGHGMSSISQPDIKLIHTITKVQHQSSGQI